MSTLNFAAALAANLRDEWVAVRAPERPSPRPEADAKLGTTSLRSNAVLPPQRRTANLSPPPRETSSPRRVPPA